MTNYLWGIIEDRFELCILWTKKYMLENSLLNPNSEGIPNVAWWGGVVYVPSSLWKKQSPAILKYANFSYPSVYVYDYENVNLLCLH